MTNLQSPRLKSVLQAILPVGALLAPLFTAGSSFAQVPTLAASAPTAPAAAPSSPSPTTPAATTAAPAAASALTAPTAAELESHIRELESKLQIQERRWEVEQEAKAAEKEAHAKALPPPGPTADASAKGFSIKSADGAYALRIKGLLQVDGRFYEDPEGPDTFLLRRARPILDGTLAKYYEFRITPELAPGATVTALDVYGNVHVIDEIQLRAGKFTSPMGLERLAPASDNFLIEYGLPEVFVPNRDTGLDLHGDILGGAISYDAAFLNGALDGASTGDTDVNHKKDLVGRLFIKPFRLANSPSLDFLKDFGFGLAASRGTHVGALSGYSSAGQQKFFSYASDAVGAGTGRRLVPQAYFFYGPLGIFGEYVRSSQVVGNASIVERVDHEAWEVAGQVFVTGDAASYTGATPKVSFDPAKGQFGALSLQGRYESARMDDEAFRLKFADINKSAKKATGWAVGASWYLTKGYRISGEYARTTFTGGAANGTDRPDEGVILTRLQAAF